jgi:hypothetical protein
MSQPSIFPIYISALTLQEQQHLGRLAVCLGQAVTPLTILLGTTANPAPPAPPNTPTSHSSLQHTPSSREGSLLFVHGQSILTDPFVSSSNYENASTDPSSSPVPQEVSSFSSAPDAEPTPLLVDAVARSSTELSQSLKKRGLRDLSTSWLSHFNPHPRSSADRAEDVQQPKEPQCSRRLRRLLDKFKRGVNKVHPSKRLRRAKEKVSTT